MQHYIHNIDPILVSLGPLAVRWYGLMYLVGFVGGFLFAKRRFAKGLFQLTPLQTQDLITYILVGMLLGARLVYVFVYSPEILQQGFIEIFAIWHGGLSYHGAALGFTVAMYLFGRKHNVAFMHIADLVAQGAALGVFFGRIGNFINGELWGRVTNVPWGVIFRDGGPLPRHPSQLYQALGEGLITFLILQLVLRYEVRKGFAPDPQQIAKHRSDHASKKHKPELKAKWQRTGLLASWYFILYGVSRIVMEFFREPDAQLGYYFGFITMGQILCVLMILIGTIVLIYRIRRPTAYEYPVQY